MMTTNVVETVHCHTNPEHRVKLFTNSDGSIHATCGECDWWMNIPTKEVPESVDQPGHR